jgi:hypothetical protein
LPGAESGATAVLPKPGDFTFLNRTRPIGLREPTHQIADGTHAEVGRREISRVADKCLHGFTRNRDIVEGTMEIRAYTEFMIRMLLAWIWLATDVAKAYDEVVREAITAVMEGLGCPQWWITHWERSWEGVRACIRTPYGETEWVEWRRGMVQGVRSACMHYVIVTIYMARAIKQEYPKIRQIWVADDGFFGTTPMEAREFLPFLRQTYRPLGLRIAQEKLETYGVNMQHTEENRRRITRNIEEVQSTQHQVQASTEEGEITMQVDEGIVSIRGQGRGAGSTIKHIQYTYPFQLEWQEDGSQEVSTANISREPAKFDQTLASIRQFKEKMPRPSVEKGAADQPMKEGQLLRVKQDAPFITRNKDYREEEEWTEANPAITESILREGTLVRYKQTKVHSGRKNLNVAQLNGQEGFMNMGTLRSATRVEIPQTIVGLIEMDGVLVHVEERYIQHMGAVLPLTEPAHIPPKTENKVNKYLKWYHEEDDRLPIMSLVIHQRSKLLGGMRTQFKAALLPIGEAPAEKRKRDEEEEEGEEQERKQQERGRAKGPPQRAKTLKEIQRAMNRAVATRTDFDNLAHVNNSWLYCPPPIGLGVPDLIKEQAATYLSTLGRLNSSDQHTWIPVWREIHHIMTTQQICTQVTLPVYCGTLPKKHRHTMAGHIVQANQELDMAIFWNVAEAPEQAPSCRTPGPILVPRTKLQPMGELQVKVEAYEPEKERAWLEQWPTGEDWVPVIPVPKKAELSSTRRDAQQGHHMTDFFRKEHGKWKMKNLEGQPILQKWLRTLTDPNDMLQEPVAQHMEWRYAQRRGVNETLQAFEAPPMALLKQSPLTDTRTRLFEKLVTHASAKSNVLRANVVGQDRGIQWNEARQKWISKTYESTPEWIKRSRGIRRTPEETWSYTPEMESLLVEELGCTMQIGPSPWNALKTIPVKMWKHEEDEPPDIHPPEQVPLHRLLIHHPDKELVKQSMEHIRNNSNSPLSVTIITHDTDIAQEVDRQLGRRPNLLVKGPAHVAWQNKEVQGVEIPETAQWHVIHVHTAKETDTVTADISTYLNNLNTWAKEKKAQVEWEMESLLRGDRKRYATNIMDIIKWIPYSARKRGVVEPEEAGYVPQKASVWHADAGLNEAGGMQTCIVTGVDCLDDNQVKVWNCPKGTTNNEGEITHLTAIVRSIVEHEQSGELSPDTTHIITVDSGATICGWKAAVDERDVQVRDRQLSPYATELRKWERQAQGTIIVCQQSGHGASPGNQSVDQAGRYYPGEDLPGWRTNPGRATLCAVRAEKAHNGAQLKACLTNHRQGKALANQVRHQHIADWAESPSGVLARIAMKESTVTKKGKIVPQGLTTDISASENERMTATQVYRTQKAAAGRMMDLATWARARKARAAKLLAAISKCRACTGQAEDNLQHWLLECEKTEAIRRQLFRELRVQFGNEVDKLTEEDWMALALGTCTKEMKRKAQQGKLTYQQYTSPKKAIEAMMDKFQDVMSILFCISRLLEAEEWKRQSKFETPLYKDVVRLKHPLDPTVAAQLTDRQQELIRPYWPLMKQGGLQPDEAQANKFEREPEGKGWEPGDYVGMGGDEEEEGDLQLPSVCPACQTRPNTTVCNTCFTDLCKPCKESGRCPDCDGEGE